MLVYVCFSIVDNLEVSFATHFLLWQLACHPFKHFLSADAVALHDALDAYFLWSRDGDGFIYQTVGTGFKENGTLHPFHPTRLKIIEHSRVNNGIDGVGMFFGNKQELCYCSLVKLAVDIGVRTNEGCELLLYFWRGAHQTFSGTVAVVYLIAARYQSLADITLAAADASSDTDFHLCVSSSSIR